MKNKYIKKLSLLMIIPMILTSFSFINNSVNKNTIQNENKELEINKESEDGTYRINDDRKITKVNGVTTIDSKIDQTNHAENNFYIKETNPSHDSHTLSNYIKSNYLNNIFSVGVADTYWDSKNLAWVFSLQPSNNTIEFKGGRGNQQYTPVHLNLSTGIGDRLIRESFNRRERSNFAGGVHLSSGYNNIMINEVINSKSKPSKNDILSSITNNYRYIRGYGSATVTYNAGGFLFNNDFDSLNISLSNDRPIFSMSFGQSNGNVHGSFGNPRTFFQMKYGGGDPKFHESNNSSLSWYKNSSFLKIGGVWLPNSTNYTVNSNSSGIKTAVGFTAAYDHSTSKTLLYSGNQIEPTFNNSLTDLELKGTSGNYRRDALLNYYPSDFIINKKIWKDKITVQQNGLTPINKYGNYELIANDNDGTVEFIWKDYLLLEGGGVKLFNNPIKYKLSGFRKKWLNITTGVVDNLSFVLSTIMKPYHWPASTFDDAYYTLNNYQNNKKFFEFNFLNKFNEINIPNNDKPTTSNSIWGKNDWLWSRDLEIENRVDNDNLGTIDFDLIFKSYYTGGYLKHIIDNKPLNNLIFDENPIYRGTITKKIKSQILVGVKNPITIVKDKLIDANAILPQDINEMMLKNILYNFVIQGKPNGFSLENIIIDPKTILRNNVDGTIEVDIKLNNFNADNNFVPSNGEKVVIGKNYREVNDFGRIVISGFSKNSATSLDNVSSVAKEQESFEYPSDIDADRLKNIVYKNLKNLPKPFDYIKEIEFDDIIRNNILGTIEFKIKLLKYYEKAPNPLPSFGIVGGLNNTPIWLDTTEVDGLKPTHFKIEGFRKSFPTTWVSKKIDTGLNYRLATNITEFDVKDIIFNNMISKVTLPEGFSTTNIKFIGEIIKNNTGDNEEKTGFVKAQVIFDYYFDDKGEIKTSGYPPTDIILTGFKTTKATSILSEYNINQPSLSALEVTQNELLTLITEKIVQNKPYPFSVNNFSFKTLDVDILKGQITIETVLNKYYNDLGILVDKNTPGFVPMPAQKTIIKGFSISGSTSIEKTYNAKQENIYADYEFIKDEEIKTIISNNMINRKPPSLSIKDIEYSPLTINNFNKIKGIITINNVKLKIFYNSEGILINNNNGDTEQFTPVNITITGFKSAEPTSIETPYDLFQKNILASDAIKDLENIKQIISKRMILSKPEIFNDFKDIQIIKSQFNNIEGSISGQVKLKNYYTESGNISPDWTNPWDFKIIGYKNIAPTELKTTIDASNKNILVQDYTNNQIKSLIAKSIPNIQKPNGFSTSNILLTNRNDIYSNGSISIDVEINNYYAADGTIKTSGFNKNIIINGLKNSAETTFRDYRVDFTGILASQYSIDDGNKELINLILQNCIDNKPASLFFDSIKIETRLNINNDKNTNSGTIYLDVEVYNYYDADGKFIDENSVGFTPLKGKIVISGFAINKGTTIISNQFNVGLQNVEINSKFPNSALQTIVFKSLVENPPEGFIPNDIIIIDDSKIIPESLGEIKFNIQLKKYFNEEGILKDVANGDNLSQIWEVNLFGFKKPNVTSIITSFDTKQSNNSPSEILNIAIENIIINNLIVNPPVGFNPTNSMKFMVLEKNNLTGEIKVEIKLTNYINESGEIVDDHSKPLTTVCVLSGYKINQKTIVPTTIETNSNLILSSEFSESNIKDLVLNKMENLPLGFAPDDIKIIKIYPNNIKGVLVVDIEINKYFNDEGILNESVIPLNKTITITNFIKIKSTIVNIPADGINSFLPDVTFPTNDNDFIKQIRNLVFKYIDNTPSDFKDTDIDISKIVRNKKDGLVNFDLSLSKYYDKKGEIKLSGFTPINIKIYGYKQFIPTTFDAPPFGDGYLINTHMENTLPAEFDINLIKSLLKNFLKTLPPSFTGENIKITNQVNDNINGKINLTFTLNNYYDANGEHVNSPITPIPPLLEFVPINVTLEGFATSQQTTFINDIITDNKNSSVWEMTNDQIKLMIIQKAIKNLPSVVTLENFKIIHKNYDKKGQIKVDYSIPFYYNSEGQLRPSLKTYTTNIVGFKIFEKTVMKDKNINAKQGNMIASTFLDKQLINILLSENYIENLPFYFREEDIIIKNRIDDNNGGNIMFDALLKIYYDQNGKLIDERDNPDIEAGLLIKDITLTGFKEQAGTTFASYYDTNSITSFPPTDPEIIKNIVIEKMSVNLPTEFNLEAMTISNIVAINKFGRVSFDIAIKSGNYFNDDGSIGEVDKKFVSTLSDGKFLLTGYKSEAESPATAIKTIDSLQPKEQASSYLANTEFIKKIIFENIKNAPLNLTIDEIKILSVKDNDPLGLLNVKFSLPRYIDNSGFESLTNKVFYVEINGFLTFKVVPEYVFENNKWLFIIAMIIAILILILITIIVRYKLRNRINN